MTHLADKKKKSDPPALYKHEGVAICLVMHLICCQQLCTWQLMLISLYFHYLCIFTSAELWEGVNVVAAVLIDEGVNLGEGGKENWPFLLLQIPPEGISLYPPPERFIQPEKIKFHIREKLYFSVVFLSVEMANHWFASDVMPVWLHPVLVAFRLQFSNFHKTHIQMCQASHVAVSRSGNWSRIKLFWLSSYTKTMVFPKKPSASGVGIWYQFNQSGC